MGFLDNFLGRKVRNNAEDEIKKAEHCLGVLKSGNRGACSIPGCFCDKKQACFDCGCKCVGEDCACSREGTPMISRIDIPEWAINKYNDYVGRIEELDKMIEELKDEYANVHNAYISYEEYLDQIDEMKNRKGVCCCLIEKVVADFLKSENVPTGPFPTNVYIAEKYFKEAERCIKVNSTRTEVIELGNEVI